jgi:hypothetical protein
MAPSGGVPERPKGTGCKPVGSAYGGSNPPAPTLHGGSPALHTGAATGCALQSLLDGVGSICDATSMKGQQKPKQLAKKAPQKTLKEQRAAKKAKKKDY